tara:strand:+ start:3664 stop:6696 length:3033 start_codon:yes stop_codon:yes gene_type:complete
MASNPDEPEDKIATNFVIKVYETKDLAEKGKDANALYVFENGIDADTDDDTDPRVSNGSQFFNGTTKSSTNTPTTLVDSSSSTRFGSRLSGKNITIGGNITTITGVAADGTSLNVAASGGDSLSYHIHTPGPFFIFTKYFYRLESTDPVKGFIIDWDDGEDNSPEKANRQTIMLDSPRYYAVVSHTYTKHGVFYPMLRTISPEGFYSKWYVSFDALNYLSSIESQTLGQGQQDFSIVSLDLQQANGILARMPEFAPANMPPIGILKTDRSSVYSGIDNSSISGNAVGYCHSESTSTTQSSARAGIEVIYKTTTGRILKDTCSAQTTPGNFSKFPADTSTNGYLAEVLSVKIVNLLEGTANPNLQADERVHIKYYTSSVSVTTDNVITTVSLGNPIQTLDRTGFSVVADGGQSQTRASNVSINKYWFETGKLEGTIRQEVAIMGHSDFFGFSVGAFDQTESSQTISYALNPNKGSVKNPNTERYYEEDRLIRLQVEDTSSTSRTDDTTYYTGGTDVNKNINGSEFASSTTATSVTIETGSGLIVGDVIATAASGIREFMKIIKFTTSDTVITVERGFQGTTATNHANNANIFRLGDNGRQGDSLTRSFIEHWNTSAYADDLNRPSSLFTRGLLEYANPTDGTSAADTITPDSQVWRNAEPENATNTDVIFGGTGSGTGTFNRYELTAGGQENHPTNFLAMCKTDKFNKIFLNIENLNNSNNSPYFRKVNLSLWYSAKTSKIGDPSIKWKPLSFVDGTSTGDPNSSLHHSGSLTFDMPDDWVSTTSAAMSADVDGDLSYPVRHNDAVGNSANLATDWIEGMYGLLIGIAIDDSPSGAPNDVSGLARIKCFSIHPYNNSHSQVIRVIDPHHKSLNDVAISQSVSWSRKGKIMEIKDKLGRSEIRKIGAAGGTIKFGGVELTGDYNTSKAAVSKYQREATPVYLDVERKNGDFIRFYGVIETMSEDYPTGGVYPKWGIQMKVEYVIEYDSSGVWLTNGMLALGGEVVDEPKYVL